MAGAIVQQRATVLSLGVTTVSDTITGVVAGNHIVAFVGCDNGGGAITISSVSDGTAYTLGDSKRVDSGNNQFGTVYFLPNAGSGSHAVTATATGGTPGNMLLRLFEVSGLQTGGGLDQNIGQFQASAGTGANAVSSSATSATTNANDFIMGFTQNTGEALPGTSTITAGTGFTKSGTDNYMACESKSVAATGAQTATFTQSVNVARVSHVIAFKEAGGGGGGNAYPLEELRRNRPGRGPYSTDQYFRPSLDAFTSSAVTHTSVATDTISLSDSAVSITQRLSVATDSISLADSAVSITTRLSDANDTLTLSDSALSITQRLTDANDSITLTDSAIASHSAHSPVATDSLTLTDSGVSISQRISVAVDSLALSDSAVAHNTIAVAIAADFLSLSDSAICVSSAARPAPATPGRKLSMRARFRDETEEEKRLRRIRQGIILEEKIEERAPVKADPQAERRLQQQIESAQRQAAEYRARFAAVEARRVKSEAANQKKADDMAALDAQIRQAEQQQMELEQQEIERQELERQEQEYQELQDVAFIASQLHQFL